MKTFKQFITEEDDAFDALGEIMDIYQPDKPIYCIFDDGNLCSVTTTLELLNGLKDDLEDDEDDGGIGLMSIVNDNNELSTVSTDPTPGEILSVLNRNYIVVLHMGDYGDYLYCRDKKKLQEFLPFYVKSRYENMTDENIARFVKYVINRLDELP